MLIRLIITIIFIIIGYFKSKKTLIIEKETNPKLKKDGKLNFLTSSIPFTLFLVFLVYAIVLFASIFYLQSKCIYPTLKTIYNYDTLTKNYENNTRKNQIYVLENNKEKLTIRNVDKLTIKESEASYAELYELKSNNKIIDCLLYGTFERELIIYEKQNNFFRH